MSASPLILFDLWAFILAWSINLEMALVSLMQHILSYTFFMLAFISYLVILFLFSDKTLLESFWAYFYICMSSVLCRCLVILAAVFRKNSNNMINYCSIRAAQVIYKKNNDFLTWKAITAHFLSLTMQPNYGHNHLTSQHSYFWRSFSLCWYRPDSWGTSADLHSCSNQLRLPAAQALAWPCSLKGERKENGAAKLLKIKMNLYYKCWNFTRNVESNLWLDLTYAAEIEHFSEIWNSMERVIGGFPHRSSPVERLWCYGFLCYEGFFQRKRIIREWNGSYPHYLYRFPAWNDSKTYPPISFIPFIIVLMKYL